MTGRIVLAMPRTPRSVNALGFRGSSRELQREKRAWEDEIAMSLMAEGFQPRPQFDHISASVVLRFPTNRRRDTGNFRVLLEKAIGDALRGPEAAWKEGRWIPDDTPEHYEFKALTFAEDVGHPRTLITLAWRR